MSGCHVFLFLSPTPMAEEPPLQARRQVSLLFLRRNNIAYVACKLVRSLHNTIQYNHVSWPSHTYP